MNDVISRLGAALADRYRIERELGAGGMATVYLAHDIKHDRQVAIKVLKPELAAVLGAERFVVEIKTTAALQHPHILPLFDSGTADGFLYYVMPFIDGETLRSKLNRETQFGIDEAVKIACNVADALDYAHRHGVIHRDIKPENILMHDGRPMVADFGIALAVSAAAGGRMTETGLSLGTPHYMSPEQATAEKEISARSDVYSIGSVLYEMLTGNPPYTGASAQQIIMKIITETAEPVTKYRKSVPPNVAAAVAKSLEKLPADRFESAAAFAAALTNTGYTLPLAAGAAGAGAPGTRWKERAAVPLAVVAVLMVAVAAWGWMRPKPALQVARMPFAMPDSQPVVPQYGTLFSMPDDGSKIVYVGPGVGDIDLWVRPMASLSASRLPDGAGGDSPFISPDGSQVAFYRNRPNSLFVISLTGGPRKTMVSDSLLPDGGDWGPDGAIYFTRARGLRRLKAGATVVEMVTQRDSAADELSHSWPDVLPKGKGALFTIVRSRATNSDIAVVDFKSGKVKVLFRGTFARYMAPGFIVYADADGRLFSVPFDEGKLATHGTAVGIASGIGIGEGGAAHFAVSQTGTLLTGSGGVAVSKRLAWVDRKGTERVVDSTLVGDFLEVVLSPDGKRAAFMRRNGNMGGIFTKELDDGPMSQLSSSGVDAHSPSWSPDGLSVQYVVHAANSSTLMRRRADGSRPAEPLMTRAARVEAAFLSPDGAWVVFSEYTGKNRSLWARRVKGDTTAVALTPPEVSAFQPRLSPDGRWLAYVSLDASGPEVFISPFPNVSAARTQVSNGGEGSPFWSRDGRELFFRDKDDYMSVARIATAPSVRVTDRKGLFDIFNFEASSVSPPAWDVSRDGTRFIGTRRGSTKGERLELVLNLAEELKSGAKP